MNKFSTAIKYLRLREGLTQKELADKLSVAKSTISMYENDARVPELERLEEIADFFNVDMNFLLGKSKMPPEDVGEQKLRLMEMEDYGDNKLFIGKDDKVTLVNLTDSNNFETYFCVLVTWDV